MKETTEQYIDKKYKHYSIIYTDASKEKDKVGSGIYVANGNKTEGYKISDSVSITTGELVAIRQVLENALSSPNPHVGPQLICTDSLGACLALETVNINNTARPDIITDILKLHNSLTQKNIHF